MKALGISINNIKKLSFIFELGSYAFINDNQFESDVQHQEMLDDYYESEYLYEKIVFEADFERILNIKDSQSFHSYDFLGTPVNSLDTLKTLLISESSIAYFFFVDNNKQSNVYFWKKFIRENYTSNTYPFDFFKEIFEMNKNLISESNRFQVWTTLSIFGQESDMHMYRYIVTGMEDVLENIIKKFNEPQSRLGKFSLYFDDDYIEWIDI